MRAQRDGWKAEAEGHAAESALRETSVLKQQAEIVDLKVLDGRHGHDTTILPSHTVSPPHTPGSTIPSLPSTAPQAALKNLEESRVTEKSQLTEAVSAAREAAIALKRSQREASSSFQKGLAVREEYEASLSKEVCSRSQAKQAHCNQAHLPILLLFSCVCAAAGVRSGGGGGPAREGSRSGAFIGAVQPERFGEGEPHAARDGQGEGRLQ